MWLLDIELIPETIATGAAISKGQGEATTITWAKRKKCACQPRAGLVTADVIIAAIPMIKETIVNGTA